MLFLGQMLRPWHMPVDWARIARHTGHPSTSDGCGGGLTIRDALVRSRTRRMSVVRALLRQYGSRLRSGTAESCIDRVTALELSAELQAEIAPLLRAMEASMSSWPPWSSAPRREPRAMRSWSGCGPPQGHQG